MKTAARELLASLVVFLVALPLCMGIAIASGAPPEMGLVAGIVGGLVVGSLAGSPLQVSGPAAGLAVLVMELIQQHGLAALAVMVMVAGVIQISAGKLGLGRWFRAVAPAVIYAMLAGIGVLIFASQFHVMVDDSPAGSGLDNLLTIPGAVIKGLSDPSHQAAASIGAFSLVVLVSWQLIRSRLPSALQVIPGPLLAVVVASGAAFVGKLEIAYVAVPSDLSSMFRLPALGDFSSLLNPAILASALALAVIASAESLLCASAVDKLHDGVRSDLDKELTAQGVGNLVSGFIGGLPLTGVIVRSTANVAAGGSTRWSAILHGIWLLAMVALAPGVLALIPVAGLAAILVHIGWKLVDVKVMKALYARGRSELAIYGVTLVAIVSTNLLDGLMVGLVLSVLRIAWLFSHVDISKDERADGSVDVRLKGAATFVGLPDLARALETIPEDREIHLHLEELSYIDHACLELLRDHQSQRVRKGGALHMEWEEVERRNLSPRKAA